MSLYARSFVRGLRRRARVEAKRHPQWKIEARAARKAARRSSLASFRWMIPLLAILAGATAEQSLLPPILLLWSTVLMLARAAQIQTLFFAHAESTPFYQFPVSERFVFLRAARQLVRSALWLAVDVLFLFATLALRLRGPEEIAGSVLVALASALGVGAATLAGAIVLVWLRPQFPFVKVSAFSFFFGIVGFSAAANVGLLRPASIRAAYESAKWFLPPGWVCILIEPWLDGSSAMMAVSIALLTALVLATVHATRSLHGAFTFWERPSVQTASEDELPPEAPVARVSEVEDALATRSFLAARDWARGGFIERTAARWLTPRESRAMDLAQVAAPAWTRRYPYGCVLILAAPLLAWIARRSGTEPGWVFAIGTLTGLGLLTPFFGGTWSAFSLIPMANRATAICNLWPVTLRELRGCVLKVNYTRLLCALPWWLFAGAMAGDATLFGTHAAAGLIFAGKFWLIAVALQPFFLTFKYSASTNDTSSGCLFIIAFFGLAFAITAAFGAAVVFSFQEEKFALWLGAISALALLSWLFEAAYRRAWRAQQFDLLAKSSGSGSA